MHLSGQFISTSISYPRSASHCRRSLIPALHYVPVINVGLASNGRKGSCDAVWSILAKIASLRRVQTTCHGSERGMQLRNNTNRSILLKIRPKRTATINLPYDAVILPCRLPTEAEIDEIGVSFEGLLTTTLHMHRYFTEPRHLSPPANDS